MVPNATFASTGVLQLGVTSSRRYAHKVHYRDRRGRRLEELLGAVLRDVELHHLYAEEARREAKRRADARRLEKQRKLKRAKQRYLEDQRIAALDKQLADWQRARLLREFADAVGGEGAPPASQEWITWVQGRADAIDPTLRALEAPQVAEPSLSDLAPYLGLESPYVVASWLES